MAIYGSMLELVGDTPLVRLSRIDDETGDDERARATVWAKCEQLEPAGSVKDRIALAMIERAEADGRLRPGGTVIEPTSGNTGIALAMVCAVKGYRCVLTLPASMSLERRQLLEAFGAEVVLTEPERQMEGAIAKAEELARTIDGAFVPHQFDNPANPDAHRETAREIVEALRTAGVEHVDAFVGTIGTGGTITGVSHTLRDARGRRAPGAEGRRTSIIGVEPERCATISRGERGPTKIQGLAAGFVPSIFDRGAVDEIATVDDDDAWRTMRALARREGLLVGISSGAAVFAALRVARAFGPGKHVVTVLCDTGERYFSLAEHFAHLPEAPPWA
ncbi:MAG: cysteine synthase A [Deltaproteobacteria bacterium]|nr:cysteine synthase A [Deltaproteobacteria bacterium]